MGLKLERRYDHDGQRGLGHCRAIAGLQLHPGIIPGF
jgi:hypothetical protein